MLFGRPKKTAIPRGDELLLRPERYAPSKYRADCVSDGSWTSLAASVIGPSHEAENLPRQDEFAQCVVSGTLVALVADGLGSAPYSHVGAAVVVRQIERRLLHLIESVDASKPLHPEAQVLIKGRREPIKWKEIITGIVRDSREMLMPKPTRSASICTPFDTTLVGAIARKDSGFFFHIGDGCAVAFQSDSNGQFKECGLSPPENGEFLDETFPLTMVGFEAHLRFTSFECSNLIFMLTDGVMPFAFESDQRTLRPRFLQPIDAYLAANRNAAGAEALRQTLDGGDVRASDGDDKTLIWARCSA